MSRGRQGSRYGASGVRPVCFPRSLQDQEKLHHETEDCVKKKVAANQCLPDSVPQNTEGFQEKSSWKNTDLSPSRRFITHT